MLRKLTALAVSGLTAAALCGTAPALAQSGNISLELNAARDVEGTCRLIFVVTNNTGADLGDLAYEVVMFDSEGTVDELLTFGFGDMGKGRTKVRTFIIGEKSCGDIGRVLVNGEAACATADGGAGSCMNGLVTSSRTDIEFGT